MKQVFLHYRNGGHAKREEECLGCLMLRAFTRDKDAVDIDMPRFVFVSRDTHICRLRLLRLYYPWPGFVETVPLCNDGAVWAEKLSDIRQRVCEEDRQALDEALLMLALAGEGP